MIHAGFRVLAPALLGLLGFGFPLAACAAPLDSAPLPVLTTVRAAHDLSAGEAAKSYPVRLRGVATFVDRRSIDPNGVGLFIQDCTGSIYVAGTTTIGPVAAGTIVEVRGVSAPGGFAPIVDLAEVKFAGLSHLPANAPRMNLTRLRTGGEDGAWVELEGVVRAAGLEEGNRFIDLQLATGDGTITAKSRREPGADYSALIDATVRIHGNVAANFNPQHQLTGVHLMFPNLSAVQVVEPATTDPFQAPVESIGKLFRFRPGGTQDHRIHLRGTVTLQWPGALLCMSDETGGICVPAIQNTPAPLGSVVDLVGFATMGELDPTLANAVFRKNGGGEEVKAVSLLADQTRFSDQTPLGGCDSHLVQLDGTLSQVDVSTTRKFGGTGLGLAISRRLAERMGGAIGVESIEGQGSEFWFTVRLGVCPDLNPRTEVRGWPTEGLHGAPNLVGDRVLIVDDNQANRQMLCSQLRFWGLRPEESASTVEAREAVCAALRQGDPFRIVLIDMQMSGMDGEGLGRWLVSDARCGEGARLDADARLDAARVIMLTSIAPRYGAQRCREAGLTRWVDKPIRRAELLAALQNPVAAPATRHADEGAPKPPPLFDAAPRILLAEDNLTNQFVALGILKKLGLRADAVANGVEVLTALQTIPYDLVLMDMRMPVMDGIEATARIRDQNSAVLNRAVPVVAMTANVQQADRQRCLDAGMNGFVSKPVSPEALRAALVEWLPTRPPASASQLPIVDRAAFLDRMMQDEEMASAVLDLFLDDLPHQIEALRQQLAAGDTSASGLIAHSIKGAAANVSAERLRQHTQAMEDAASQGNLDALRQAMPGLDACCEDLSATLRKGSRVRLPAETGP